MGQEGVLLALRKPMDFIHKTTVERPVLSLFAVAFSTASRISFTPPSTAEIEMNGSPKASAINLASVVLPTPGGPHKIIE